MNTANENEKDPLVLCNAEAPKLQSSALSGLLQPTNQETRKYFAIAI